jgi:PST family polysaccharide transporter
MVKPFNENGDFDSMVKADALRRTAIRGAGAAIAGQMANFILSLASVVILARLLTPADFGIVTMATTVGLVFRSFGLNGFTEVILQREDMTDALASNLFWIQLGIGMLLAVAFAASGPLMALFYHNPAVAGVASGMSAMIALGCLGWIHLGLLQRAMYFKAAAIINFAGQAVFTTVSIMAALGGWRYWSLVFGIVAQSAATAAGAWWMCRWIPSWPRRVKGTGAGVKFAMSVYSHYAFAYLTNNTDNLLVGWRFGAQALGFYKKAFDLFVLPQSQLLNPMSAVVLRTLSRVNEDRQLFRRYYLRTISVLALIGMGMGAEFALVGRDLIRVILGPEWSEAGRIFTLFGPGIGVMLLYATHGWIHLSIGRPTRWLYWGLIEFGCTVSLFLVGLHWGPSGVALAWTVALFLLMFPGLWYAGKPIELGIGAILAAIWKFFFASICAGGMTALVVSMAPHVPIGSGASTALVKLIAVSIAFLTLYLGWVIVLHRGLEPISQTIELLRDLLPQRRDSPEAAGSTASNVNPRYSIEAASGTRD